jgi:2-polyprenyl-3-methyl-5-hydroxy-6-metoxy-1,4-benzoquinol methylase
MNEDLKLWNEASSEFVTKVKAKRSLTPQLIQPELLEILKDLQSKSILDAGCGEGMFANFLTNHGAIVTGIDGSESMIQFARKKYPNMKLAVVDLMGDLPFAAETFDAVVSIFVVMSLSDLDNFLAESYRVLKKGGKLVICTFHPAFNYPTMKLHRGIVGKLLNKKVIGIVDDYFKKTTIRKDDAASKPWPYYHRTLAEYTRAILKSGFVIKGMHEPHNLPQEYLKQHPEHEYATRLPRLIIFDLEKNT